MIMRKSMPRMLFKMPHPAPVPLERVFGVMFYPRNEILLSHVPVSPMSTDDEKGIISHIMGEARKGA